jgi:hypothetical protein
MEDRTPEARFQGRGGKMQRSGCIEGREAADPPFALIE